MSQSAERTRIGRATLYKYFPDVESMLLAWHERQIAWHLTHLMRLRDEAATAAEHLEAVLEAYALIHHRLAADQSGRRGAHGGSDIATLLHGGQHIDAAQQELTQSMRDVPALPRCRGPACVGVSRLVNVTFAGLRLQR